MGMNATQLAASANKILRSKRCKAYAHEYSEMGFNLEFSPTQVAVTVETRDMPKSLSKYLRRRDYKSEQAFKKATATQKKNRLVYNNEHVNKAIKALEGSVRITRKIYSTGFVELRIR